MKVKVDLPVNLSKEDKMIFEDHKEYDLQDISIIHTNNILVTYEGFCVDGIGLMKESHHTIANQINGYAKQVQLILSRLSIAKSIILNDEDEYLVVHHPWFFNYYHWVCEGILRIWTVKDLIKDLILILPEDYTHVDFIMQSLKPFTFKGIYILPRKADIFVKKLCIPQIKRECDTYYRNEIVDIANFYKNSAKTFCKCDVSFGPFLYISRAKSNRRKVVNEEDLKRSLNDFGIVTICNEDLNFWEQISVYERANMLISNHGAGLTNMIFMNKGSKIFEFHKLVTNKDDWYSLAYWSLSSVLNYEYYYQICKPTSKIKHFFEADIAINIDELKLNLSKLFNNL